MRRIQPATVVVAAGIAAALHVGKLPTAVPVLREALGITLVQAGFLLSLVQLAGMLLGVVAGLAADGLGLRRTIIAGLLLLAAASVAGAAAKGPGMLMVLRAVEGAGFLLAAMPAPSLIRRLVPRERVNAALGWWGTYMPVGTAIALLAGPHAIAALGWQGWWIALGAVSVAMAAAVAACVPPDPPRAAIASAPWTSRLRRTLVSSGPWLVALTFGVYSAQWLVVIGFLPTVYQQAGIAPGLAGSATALVALMNMVGNVASGRLLQRQVPPEVLLRVGFTAMAIGGLVTFAPFGGPVLRYAAALAFSMLGGLVPATLFAQSVRLAPGEDTVSTTVGWMQQWSCVGQFAGPPVVAWIASVTGVWHWSGVVTATCAVAGLLLTFPLGARAARGLEFSP